MKKILNDIWRNYKTPIIGGTLMFVVMMCYVTDFELDNIGWFFLGISIATGGTVAALIYGIKEYLK